jgi:hypothetical protein
MQLELHRFLSCYYATWYHLPRSDFMSHCCKGLKSDICYFLLCLEGWVHFNFSFFLCYEELMVNKCVL